jgi:outer membrane protein insertion porin family
LKLLSSILVLGLSLNAQDLANNIKFEGLTQISPKIANEIINKTNNNYTSEDINKAIKKFYEFNYFNDIQVFKEDNKLIFKFTEKPFIINLKMTGYKTRDDDLKALYTSIGIEKGNMYTPARIEKAKKLLLEQLKLEGYAHSVVEVDIQKVNLQSVTVTFNVNKGDEIIIKKNNFIGAKSIDTDILDDAIANKEEDLVSWWFGQSDGVMQLSQLQYDSLRVKDTYFKNGYLDAKVKPAYGLINFNTNKAEVDYVISEGKQYKINKILLYLNEKIVSKKDIEENLKLKQGKVFNIEKLRRDVTYIKTQVANKGYAFTKVKYDIRKNRKDHTADIILNVIEGDKVYINDVIITNNSRTLDRVIRRNVYLAPGDLFNLTDFKDSKSKLQRSGFFQGVKITKKRVSKDKIDLIVDVKEAPTGNLVFGGGYSSYDGWMINASVNDKNIFGSGIDLGLSFEHSSKKDTATISIKNPALYDSIYNGSFNIYKKSSTIDASDTSTDGDETTDTTGLSVGIGRSLNRHTRVGATYALEEKDTTYTINTSLNENYISSSLTPYISFNNTDDYYVPRSGIKAGSSLQYAGLGGDVKYIQNSFYFKYFLGLEDYIDYDAIFRFKTSMYILNDLGELKGKSYTLGGPSTLRGYKSYAFQADDNENHPYKKLSTNTIEMSFPLMPKAKMRWALFADLGMIGEDSFTDIKKAGYGVSVNWYSPVGPIQFIFSRAYNPADSDSDKTSNFEFSIGSNF